MQQNHHPAPRAARQGAPGRLARRLTRISTFCFRPLFDGADFEHVLVYIGDKRRLGEAVAAALHYPSVQALQEAITGFGTATN
ncbi:MAG: hypothetical protein JO122_18185 [Acetobacteraceae bacterium]|nr:hypothetical protein [Acetobacteraceae bacterium]